MNKLNDFVNCKQCKYYKVKNVHKDAQIYYCSKDCDSFDLDSVENKIFKKCFKKKAFGVKMHKQQS